MYQILLFKSPDVFPLYIIREKKMKFVCSIHKKNFCFIIIEKLKHFFVIASLSNTNSLTL